MFCKPKRFFIREIRWHSRLRNELLVTSSDLLNTTRRRWMYQATKLLTLQHHRPTLTFKRPAPTGTTGWDWFPFHFTFTRLRESTVRPAASQFHQTAVKKPNLSHCSRKDPSGLKSMMMMMHHIPVMHFNSYVTFVVLFSFSLKHVSSSEPKK